MNTESFKVGDIVKSVVNPDRIYKVVGLYESYAKVTPHPKLRHRDEYNIEYNLLTKNK